MKRLGTSLLPFISPATANISLQLFSDTNCGASGGNVIANVQSNPANEFDASRCIAPGQYGSVQIVSKTNNFRCNTYFDAACANFLTTQENVSQCAAVMGQGVICFDQGQFDDPNAGTIGTITVGSNIVSTIFARNTDNFLMGSLVDQMPDACSDNACDPTRSFIREFRNNPCHPELPCDGALFCGCSTITCTQIARLSGNFDNKNQRDYMLNLLKEAMNKATGPVVSQDNGDPFGGLIHSAPSFFQIVLENQRSGNRAELTFTVELDCDEDGIAKGPFSCDGALTAFIKAAVGLIPSVGGIAAGVIDVGCAL